MLKTPFLVQHFMEHQHQNASISISQFLSMHYLGQDAKDNDVNKDMKLPFKKVDTHTHLVLFQTIHKRHRLFHETDQDMPDIVYLRSFLQDPVAEKPYKPPQA
ncbi:hypothetical protein ACSBL2_21430 [Pedobacter sp. AW31-3R]|uniref:hypothetical protein n=1 Tax=Pedobacter sp. AW31-3R TaxID=3445781 RepID=UPI003FA0920D